MKIYHRDEINMYEMNFKKIASGITYFHRSTIISNDNILKVGEIPKTSKLDTKSHPHIMT